MNETNRQPHKLKNPEEKKRYLPIPYEQLGIYLMFIDFSVNIL